MHTMVVTNILVTARVLVVARSSPVDCFEPGGE